MIMTSSFSQVLLSIKNEVSLAGMLGIQYKSLVERHSLTQKLGYFIAIQIIAHHTHLIKHGDNVLDSNSFLFDQYLTYYEQLCCFANVGEMERVFHMTVPGALDEDNGHLGQILETVSKSQEKGCLVSDLTKNESGAQNHTYVDKLIGLGCLVKQGINPLISSESRTESKSVVVHNKLYAPHYNNLADGVKLVVGNGQLDRIHDLIIDILDKRNVQVLPARDLARQMGMSRWDMQALRNASLAQDKKEPAKVKFFQMICNSRLKNGTLSSALLMWCVSKASDLGYYDSSTGKYAFTSPRNFSVYETVAASLAEVDTGLTANDIRVRTGAPYKKAAKIFVSFHKNFGFPLEKFQDGKQLKHRILPKQCASEGFRKLSLPSNRLFSDQQLLNTETIVEFLQKQGGVASMADVILEVRQQCRRRLQMDSQEQGTYTMDKRTIERAVYLLEHTLHRVASFIVDCNQSTHTAQVEDEPTQLSLLVLRGDGLDPQRMISEYFVRRDSLETCPPEAVKAGIPDVNIEHTVPKKRTRSRRANKSGHSSDSDESYRNSEAELEGGPSDDATPGDISNVQLKRPRLEARLRSHLINQKRTIDDPDIFVLPVEHEHKIQIPIDEVQGYLISAMCLHAQLVGMAADRFRGPDVVGAELRLEDVCKSLPFLYYYKTSSFLQARLAELMLLNTDSEQDLPSAIKYGLKQRVSVSTMVDTDEIIAFPSCLQVMLREYLADHAPGEVAVGFLFLASVGILEVRDSEGLLHLARIISESRESAQNTRTSQRSCGITFLDSALENPSQLHMFARLWNMFATGEIDGNILKVIPFVLNVLPPGAWKPVQCELEVYHYWKTVVVPSLPLCWEGFSALHSFSQLGFHALRFWGESRKEELSEEAHQALSRGDIPRNVKVKMGHWGCQLIQDAWRDLPALSWKSLMDMVWSERKSIPTDFTESTNVSLDMPLRTTTPRKKAKRPSTESGVTTSAGKSNFSHSKRKRADVDHDEVSSTTRLKELLRDSAATEEIDEDEAAIDRLISQQDDAQLQEELLCLNADDNPLEWTARQVAIVLEVVLIKYLVPERFLPAALRIANKTSQNFLYYVNPTNSFIDIQWESLNFSTVSEAMITASIANSKIPNQKVARHRVLQCIKYRPTLRGIAAWVLCNKGGHLSPSFARVLTQALQVSGSQLQLSHDIAARIYQPYEDFGFDNEGGVSKSELTALQQYPLLEVMRVTRELFVRGLIQQSDNCGREACRTKASLCCHAKRAFEVTDLFREIQSGILSAPFYGSWINHQVHAGTDPSGDPARFSPQRRGGRDPILALAALLDGHNTVDAPQCVLVAAHSVSVIADSVVSLLDLSNQDFDCALSSTLQVGGSAYGAVDLLRADVAVKDVWLLRKEACETHSGFCERALNDSKADLRITGSREVLPFNQQHDVALLAAILSQPCAGCVLPWQAEEDGELKVNSELFQSFASKVLAILADKPGSNFANIHASLLVLGVRQTRELLRILLEVDFIACKKAARVTTMPGPFDTSIHTNLDTAGYFLGQCFV